MKRLLGEPLMHFLLLGVGLFILYGFLHRASPDADPQTIVVNREKLLTFIQYRSRAFDTPYFKEVLNSLPKEELQPLIRDYVREEALYREAKALRLDQNDYVARLRMIRQLEFINRGFAEAQGNLNEQEIQRYYAAHQHEYRINPKVTFTHVFFSTERHDVTRALALARAELRKLNQTRVRFDQAPEHGERFLYQLNYVEREPEEVAGHFGAKMQGQLFALAPDNRSWRGPFQSPYGFHLVLLTANESGRLPALQEVRKRVEQESGQALLERQFEQSIQSIVKAYKVKVEPIQTTGASS